MKNVEELQAIVNPGVVITEHNGVIYADSVEDNGDEFRLTQSPDINEVHVYLKDNGLLASGK